MKIKTSELAGLALDWAVAKCEGYKDQIAFSTCWEHGGPIIEREKIDLEGRWNVVGCGVRESFKCWDATHPKNHGGFIRFHGYGSTPLIAAMRCYVASKLGDEVDVPECLT